jgi:hypothetical protein
MMRSWPSGVLANVMFENEASMTTEPGELFALVHACQCCVFIGDDKLLGRHAMESTLRDRLREAEAPMTLLHVQHRIH